MYDIDSHEAQSPTAMICKNAQLFGATPERGEFDPHEVWDRDEAITAVSEAFRILAEGAAPDGSQLANEREHCCGDSSTRSTPRCAGSTEASTASAPNSATCNRRRTAARSRRASWS